MTDWPQYQIGPKDSVFALGVVSANYVKYEQCVLGMFIVIVGLDVVSGRSIMFKLGTDVREKLMREMILTWPWPEDTIELCNHFIDAHKIIVENRNKLMHSNIMYHGKNHDGMLYKTMRDGTYRFSMPSLVELRRVADDMQIYHNFGVQLATKLKADILKIPPLEGEVIFNTWPDKPPLPIPLQYSPSLP